MAGTVSGMPCVEYICRRKGESWCQRSGEATEGCSQSYGYFAGDNGGGKPRADRVCGNWTVCSGGGIVKGSLVLVGGDPGIGKSTILLQMCRNLVHQNVNVLYVSGEESLSQIKMRAERIGVFEKDMLLLCDNDMDNIERVITKSNASVVIIDSIQTMVVEEVGSAPGTVTQVREVTARLMQVAKQYGIAIFIVGHVTKEGNVAGPRTLEHM